MLNLFILIQNCFHSYFDRYHNFNYVNVYLYQIFKGNEDCVRTKGPYGLHDDDCRKNGPFVCEGHSKNCKYSTFSVLYISFKTPPLY